MGGFVTTVQLFCLTPVFALPLGLLISFGSMSRITPLRALYQNHRLDRPRHAAYAADHHVSTMCPACWLWGKRQAARRFSGCSAVAFVINYAFYFSEIFRGGIQGVPEGPAGGRSGAGHDQARRSSSRSRCCRWSSASCRPCRNEIITLVKDTSLARIIAMQEIICAAGLLKGSSRHSGLIWPLFFTGVYLPAVQRRPDAAVRRAWKRGWIISREEERDMAYSGGTSI